MVYLLLPSRTCCHPILSVILCPSVSFESHSETSAHNLYIIIHLSIPFNLSIFFLHKGTHGQLPLWQWTRADRVLRDKYILNSIRFQLCEVPSPLVPCYTSTEGEAVWEQMGYPIQKVIWVEGFDGVKAQSCK